MASPIAFQEIVEQSFPRELVQRRGLRDDAVEVENNGVVIAPSEDVLCRLGIHETSVMSTVKTSASLLDLGLSKIRQDVYQAGETLHCRAKSPRGTPMSAVTNALPDCSPDVC
ncbi:protein of unknown function [Methylocaldum szegediense]|uniref:Uncharacterized protein n=1 Tax=Methylocaldum szegediense TaxID=73780 RepID=A0ABN8X407_9GAMM|nr:protein of unknown function [Methylocaldum szegediense]